MKRTLVYRVFPGLFFLLNTLVLMPASAAVKGACANCHTMHNSEGNSSMMRAGGSLTTLSGPEDALLRSDCLGCHTGSNSNTSVTLSGAFDAPFVYNDTEPTYDQATPVNSTTLAGGDFYWTKTNELSGHNMELIQTSDKAAPGDPAASPLVYELTCAGVNGCHGDRTVTSEYESIYGSHHENSNAVVSNSDFRILDGIKGVEDSDWEWQPTSSSHNIYYGEDRIGNSNYDTENSPPVTISDFCAICHGLFHNGDSGGTPDTSGISDDSPSPSSFASPWIRHPVDTTMPTTGTDFDNYNTYSLIAPLASDDITTDQTYDFATKSGDRIIMCLTCHRAHGSPYDSILRWDYKNWPGSGYAGCQICHTSKS